MSAARLLANWIMRRATSAPPAEKAEWAEAMCAEFDGIADDRAALGWAIGCGRTAMGWMRLRLSAAYVFELGVGSTGVIWMEWATDEVTVVLAMILMASATVGLFWPRRFVLTGLVVGWAMPLAHLLTEAAGRFRPHYMTASPSIGDALTLFVLVVPALAAAGVGALIGRMLRLKRLS